MMFFFTKQGLSHGAWKEMCNLLLSFKHLNLGIRWRRGRISFKAVYQIVVSDTVGLHMLVVYFHAQGMYAVNMPSRHFGTFHWQILCWTMPADSDLFTKCVYLSFVYMSYATGTCLATSLAGWFEASLLQWRADRVSWPSFVQRA